MSDFPYGIVNAVPVSATLLTSGQPTAAQLAALAADGFGRVARFSTLVSGLSDEAGVCAALKLDYFHHPVEWADPRLEDFAAFAAFMNGLDEAGEGKILIHCAKNFRVSAFLALYRILCLGWERDVALEEMLGVWEPDAIWAAFIDAVLAGPPVECAP